MTLVARLLVAGRLDVDISAEPGDVVALVGPNGAGKSTFVHALAGLQRAEGSAVLDGRDLLALAPQDRSVGVVFQDQRLFPHLSALDNVAFGLRSRGSTKASARAAARNWLDRLGVGELAGRKPAQLSGGQAQRVAIARALVTEPDLLLLDEPFTGLDVGVAATLRIELGRHLADFRGVTVLVTHDALDALTLATSVAVLDAGRIAQHGTPTDVAARPRTEHVARLVGLNVIREADRLRAFSPAAVTVSLQAPTDSTRNRWSGVVRGAAPHGDAIRLQVSGDHDLIADVTPAASRELALVPGQQVWLSVKETAVTTYDAHPSR
ncbi:ABC transporter ATP-binding protein [Nocardioides bizhenqiangii]|uniref:ABC transporter ATP-binding protein n=1 Tax=Nocardioides bizhenqiangii TaxID=3095076 RepID=A0ABZ0ZND9_9ACTN|nr:MULTISPECIES: ABC transporter ATP-binding protein [unclassified Nocardioides]MDZ5621370.1 ABC transporter ATP-binding protein [Nocardioides sp. HM23]WQQ25790.1 ABC transporter ATP-binding protein [Nocardioides sp. HM61]